LVGPDGPTHAGSFDLSFLGCIPNMLIMAPADENECRQMLSTGFLHDGPAAVRYPRGGGPGVAINPILTTLPIGKAEVRRHGHRVAILAFGSMVTPATIAGEALNATVVNMRFIKPLDEALIRQLATEYDLLVTVEENAILGGAGGAVVDVLTQHQLHTPVLTIGLPDRFVDQGSREELLAECGLDAASITQKIQEYLASDACQTPLAQVNSY
jgi:1-deoxy-D-xylulose-5-phosphate synthase